MVLYGAWEAPTATWSLPSSRVRGASSEDGVAARGVAMAAGWLSSDEQEPAKAVTNRLAQINQVRTSVVNFGVLKLSQATLAL